MPPTRRVALRDLNVRRVRRVRVSMQSVLEPSGKPMRASLDSSRHVECEQVAASPPGGIGPDCRLSVVEEDAVEHVKIMRSTLAGDLIER